MYCLLYWSGDVWGPDPRKDERGPQGRRESGQCRCARLQVALVGQDLTDRSAKDWWLVSTVTLVLWEVWRQKEIQDKAEKVWWLSCVAHESQGRIWQLHDDNIFGVRKEGLFFRTVEDSEHWNRILEHLRVPHPSYFEYHTSQWETHRDLVYGKLQPTHTKREL